MAGTEHVCVALDVGSNMGGRRCENPWELDDRATHQDLGLNTLMGLVNKKMMFHPRHVLGLVLFGTEETANDQYDDEADDDTAPDEERPYQHIQVEQQVTKPDLAFLRRVTAIQGGNHMADVFDALVVAVDLLYRSTHTGPKAKTGAKKVYLLTNAVNEFEYNEDEAQIVKDQMKATQMELMVGGIGFEDHSDLYDAGATTTKPVPPGCGKSQAQFERERLLCQLAIDTGGDFYEVVDIGGATSCATRETRATTTSRVNLEIGPDLKIPVFTYAFTKEAGVPPLKRVVLSTRQEGDDGLLRYAEVKQERQKYSLTEEDTMLRPEQLVDSYKYGRDRVPFSAVDKRVLQFETERVLQVLGFAARATVPQEIFMANIEVVAVAISPALELGDKEQRAGAALNALAQALFSTQKVAICRFVKRKNGTLALTAMFANPIDPTEEQDRGHEVPKDARYRLYLTTLPFSEAGELIDAMLMSEPLGGGSSDDEDGDDDDDDDDDDAAASSEPQRQFNPLLQRFYEAVQQRALNEDSRVPPRGEVELQKPVESMLKKAQSEIANFARACPLEPNLEQARKRKFTATMQDHAQSKGLDQSKGFDAFAHDAKRTKGTQSSSAANDGSGAQMAAAEMVINLTNPISDLSAIFATQPLWLQNPEKALVLMVGVVRRLVKESVRGHNYKKAIKCLRHLRRECKQDDDTEAFNTELKKMKKEYEPGTPGHGFWISIKENGVSLLSTEDCEESEEASAFLADDDDDVGPSDTVAAVPAAAQPAQDDFDDFLDDLE